MTENCPSPEEIKQAWGRLIPYLPTLEAFDITQPSIIIGRSIKCDIIMDERKIHQNKLCSISKEHVVITKDPTDANIYITDLSKNGTFLNGNVLTKNERVILRDNDKIAIGLKKSTVYIFRSLLVEDLPATLTPLNVSESPNSNYETVSILPPWGRLISCLLHLESFDLCQPTFKVGRSSVCDAAIDKMGVDPNIKGKFSKEHFVLVKDPENNVTYITDLSKTGTYINRRLVGKNRKNILQNDDTIAIGSTRTRVFVFKSMGSLDMNYLPQELRQRYEPSTSLGKGGCGEVRLAYEKTTCKMYAIKKIMKSRSTTSQLHQLNHPSKIKTEVNILQSLKHEFVINMKEIVETPQEVFIVLDYMKGGELTNRILSSTNPLTEGITKFLFYQMVLAVQFLHSKGITHRDLKPENVLLSSDENYTLIKVSDFGLSKVTEDDNLMKTICGTWCYIAPEVLDPRIPEYNKQVDVWSLGVILFYMLSKKLPFKSPDKGILGKLIKSGCYKMDDSSWDGISLHAKDLVKRMLTVNPQKRITVNQISNHPWIAKDVGMQYRVRDLAENEIFSEDDDASDNMEPPAKRIRLLSSEESTV